MITVKGEMKNGFLCTDTETEELLEINNKGEIVWTYKANTTVFDIWQLDDGNILHCHYGNGGSGARIIDRNGKVLTQYNTEHEIFTCQPIEDGKILVGELIQKRLVEADRDGKIVKIIPFEYDGESPHETMRSMRKLYDGTYMMVSPGMRKIVFFDDKGKVYKSFNTHPDTFGAVKRANGNTVYACMSGLYELDKEGNEIWSFTKEDAPDLGICWLLGLQLRANGNIVANNWLGHGMNGKGVPMFEVNRDKKIIWQCDCRERVPNLGNFYLLGDGNCSDISRFTRR